MMKLKLLSIATLTLLTACSHQQEDKYTLTSKFNSTWNLYETVEHESDGTITYNAQPWGGLVASFKERNLPVDWSKYESITFEFAEPTKVATQIFISEKVKTWGKPGIMSLTCNFDGQDVTSVGDVGLQAADTTTLRVKRVYLSAGGASWDSSPIWKGNCVFGNWKEGFVIKPEEFLTAIKGDKLEFLFHTDLSDPSVSFHQFKTVYNSTDSTLQGNENELNSWGCATVGAGARVYRITLTDRDIEKLRERGLFVNGYYNIVTQVNLLRRDYIPENH